MNEINLIPDYLIETFEKRIKKLLNEGTKDHPSIKREVDRILSINGNKLPKRIKDLIA